MANGAVFVVDGGGNLSRMSPGAPPSEDRMQELVARYPELIADSDGELLLIRREQPIADSAASTGRWSMDHLFVTHTAIPVLVELKRAVDTRLRREVVGQLLDYAANGVAYWQPGRIAEAFEATCATLGKNPEDTLSAFLNGQTPEEFWSQVDANFDAGRVKLVFVADVVPPELARVVEFLNEQMRADVRAVELNWFEGAGNATTLVPRVIGETQRAVAQKTARSAFVPVAVDDWIDTRLERHGDQASAAARAFVEMIESLGGRVEASKGSIIAVFEGQDGKAVYPMHLWESGKVSPSFEYLWKRPGLANELVRRKYYEEFAQIAGPLSTTNLKGTPGFPLVRLADPAVRTALRPVMERFFQAATVA